MLLTEIINLPIDLKMAISKNSHKFTISGATTTKYLGMKTFNEGKTLR